MKKTLAWLLTLCMILSMIPMSVFAADGSDTTYVAQIGETGYKTLQDAIDACTTRGDYTITLLINLNENVTIKQVEGVNITIDGEFKVNGVTYKRKFSGTITIHGNGCYDGEETLTIKNIAFETSEAEHYFIDSNSTGSVERYAHNVTVDNCTFTATGDAVDSAVAVRIRQGHNITITQKYSGGASITTTDMHSLFQGYGCIGVTIKNVTIGSAYNTGKNGISLGTSKDVTIENVTIYATGYGIRADGTGAYDMTVKNCTIKAKLPIVVRNTTGAYKLTLEGTNKLTANNTEKYQIIFTNGDDGTYVNPTGEFKLTGADGFKVFPTKVYVAQIGDTKYESLTDAIAAAQSGDTITLLKDVTEDVTIADDANIVLDLNGHTLNGMVTVDSDTTLTVQDSVGGGKIGGDLVGIDNYGTVTVKGGTIYGEAYGIYNNGEAIANVEGGVITSEAVADSVVNAAIYNESGVVNVTGGKIAAGNADAAIYNESGTVTVSGGEVYGNETDAGIVNEEDGAAVLSGGTFDKDYTTGYSNVTIAEGCKSVDNGDGTWTVVEAPKTYVAQIGETKYETLQDAYNAANKNDTITLLDDIVLTETLVFDQNKTVSIKTEKHNISGELDTLIKITAGTVYLKSADNFTNTGDVFYIDGGKMVIYGQNTITSQNGNCIYIRSGRAEIQTATLIANGEYPAIQGNGNYAGDVTIEGGNISAPNSDMAIYWPQNGTLTIKGGTITGDTAVYVKSGTINIIGGEFIATGDKVAFEHSSNGSIATGDALVIEACKDAAYETPKVTITGGTFTSANAAAVMFYNCNESADAAEVMEISGGTYSDRVSSTWCAEGYLPVLNSDTTWTVKQAEAVCAIGDENYASLADAVKAVPKGAGETTIKLLVPELKTNSVMVGHGYAQQITIDLNGGKLYSTDKTLTAYRSGTVLTLVNGTVSGNSTGGTLVATYGGKLVLGENLNVTAGNMASAIKIDNGTLEINNNTEVVAGANWLVVTDNAKNTVIVSSGNFSGAMSVGASANMQLSGGFYDVEPDQEWCAEGYSVLKHGKDLWTIGNGVITVDGVWFKGWDEAESSIKKDSVIVLYGDVENTKEYKFPGNAGTITLDLNGHAFASVPCEETRITSIWVSANTILQVIDSIGGGKFEIKNNSYPLNTYTGGKVIFAEGIQVVGALQSTNGSGTFCFGDTELIGPNGVYQVSGTTRVIIAENGDWTLVSGSLTMTANDATLADNTLTISANTKLDLAGNNLTVNDLSVKGALIDSEDVVGVVEIAEGEYFNGENGSYLPLYDAEQDGYRLFKVEIVNKGVKFNSTNTAAKFGFTIKFTNKYAYELMIEALATNPKFSVSFSYENGDLGTQEFSDSMLTDYAGAASANETLPVLTITLNGVETGNKLEAVAQIKSAGVVITGDTVTATVE